MGCKPKCGYHSLSSIVCSFFFSLLVYFLSFFFSYSNFLLLVLFLSVFSTLYCKFGVGFFIAVDACLYSIASFGKLKHTKYSYSILYCTLKMFLHLRTYSFFFINSLSTLFCPTRALFLFLSSFSSPHIGTIRCRKKKKIVSCVYTISLLFFNIIIHFMVSSMYKIYAVVADEKMKT